MAKKNEPRWNNFLSGEEIPTAAELDQELEALEVQRQNTNKKIDQLQSELDDANIKLLAGSNHAVTLKKIDTLAGELLKTQNIASTIQNIYEKLSDMFLQKRESEISASIDKLDQKIETLKAEQKNFKPEFLRLMGHIAGLWFRYYEKGPTPQVVTNAAHNYNQFPFPRLTSDERNIFFSSWDKAVDGQENVFAEIHSIQEQKRLLLQRLSEERREDYRLQKSKTVNKEV